jgi:prepilin-type N-terminal cleavage/methylation domain-containing protein
VKENTWYMIPSRLSAFSLPETLVVMVLSSIIVSIIYFSFQTISSYQVRLTNQKQQAEDAGTLYYLLKKDFQQSVSVKALDDDRMKCEYWNDANVVYIFQTEYVLRQQSERMDTFRMAFDVPTFLQQGNVVSDYPVVIDEALLRQNRAGGKSLDFSFYKYYDAASLLQMVKTDSLP